MQKTPIKAKIGSKRAIRRLEIATGNTDLGQYPLTDPAPAGLTTVHAVSEGIATKSTDNTMVPFAGRSRGRASLALSLRAAGMDVE